MKDNIKGGTIFVSDDYKAMIAENRRYEIAKAVLPTLISLHEAKWDINKQAICFMAKEYADKLIEVLEKK